MTSDARKPRVVAIKCPSCKGTGKFMGSKAIPCLWCKGTKKLRRPDALRYADQAATLAIGGYICGDHDWDDRSRMLTEADAITSIFKVNPFCAGAAR